MCMCVHVSVCVCVCASEQCRVFVCSCQNQGSTNPPLAPILRRGGSAFLHWGFLSYSRGCERGVATETEQKAAVSCLARQPCLVVKLSSRQSNEISPSGHINVQYSGPGTARSRCYLHGVRTPLHKQMFN